MPRYINDIIIHCTATPEGREVTVEDIDRKIGYHYVVYLDGSVHRGRAISRPGAHCYGHNAHSIGVAYVGGRTADGKTAKDTRTKEQKSALLQLVTRLIRMYKCRPHGHDEYANKACPCFDVRLEYGRIFGEICLPAALAPAPNS